MQPRILLAFAAMSHCWLIFIMVSTRTFSARLFPSVYWCLGLFLLSCGTLRFPLLNCRGSCQHIRPACPGSSGWQYNPMVNQTILCPSFVSSADLVMVHSALSFRSLLKMWNRTGPSIVPWSTAEVTGLQMDFKPLITTPWPCHSDSFQSTVFAHPAFNSFSVRIL